MRQEWEQIYVKIGTLLGMMNPLEWGPLRIIYPLKSGQPISALKIKNARICRLFISCWKWIQNGMFLLYYDACLANCWRPVCDKTTKWNLCFLLISVCLHFWELFFLPFKNLSQLPSWQGKSNLDIKFAPRGRKRKLCPAKHKYCYSVSPCCNPKLTRRTSSQHFGYSKILQEKEWGPHLNGKIPQVPNHFYRS